MKALELYLVDLTTDFIFDKKVSTYDNEVGFYTTPSLTHPGVIVKRALDSEPSRQATRREGETLLCLQGKKAKVPHLYKTHHEDAVLVMQRLYGPHLLSLIDQDLFCADAMMVKAAEWLSDFHEPAIQSRTTTLKETSSYQRFKHFLSLDANSLSKYPSFQILTELVENQADQPAPPVWTLVHGDVSPIHLYLEQDGTYGIDFNAAHLGPIEEDLASFLSNATYHLEERIGKEPTKEVMQSFLPTYTRLTGRTPHPALNFFTTFFDYLKVRCEPHDQEEHLDSLVTRFLKK